MYPSAVNPRSTRGQPAPPCLHDGHHSELEPVCGGGGGGDGESSRRRVAGGGRGGGRCGAVSVNAASPISVGAASSVIAVREGGISGVSGRQRGGFDGGLGLLRLDWLFGPLVGVRARGGRLSGTYTRLLFS